MNLKITYSQDWQYYYATGVVRPSPYAHLVLPRYNYVAYGYSPQEAKRLLMINYNEWLKREKQLPPTETIPV